MQVALKLLAGENQELLYVIPILLGCKREDVREDDYIGTADVQKILDFLKDASYSHLMEVVLFFFCIYHCDHMLFLFDIFSLMKEVYYLCEVEQVRTISHPACMASSLLKFFYANVND